MEFDIKLASDYSLPDLVELLNRGFENYFVPIQFNMLMFLAMLHKDSVDLSVSRVLLADQEPSGIALIARRGRAQAHGSCKNSFARHANARTAKWCLK